MRLLSNVHYGPELDDLIECRQGVSSSTINSKTTNATSYDENLYGAIGIIMFQDWSLHSFMP